jgi:outer membrane receptor protein involved in Fe transport
LHPFLAALLAVAADSAAIVPRVPASPADSAGLAPAAPSDTLPREVRRFPPIEVAAGRLHDMRSNATVHRVTPEALRDLPITSLTQALALQPGVVALGEDLHVRGGRAGETQWTLAGLVLNEPLRDRAPELPVMAVQYADLIAGGLDAEYAGALAGVVDLRTWNPSARAGGAVRWLTTARQGTSFDWVGARGSVPLRVAGLGLVAAGETRLDDQYLPGRPSRGREEVLGGHFGWRNDNHMLGWAKLAPVKGPQRYSIEATGSRVISQPYDPMISWNDSLLVYFLSQACDLCPPYLDSTMRYYRASDHQPMTETRRLTTLAQASGMGSRLPWRVAFSWQHGSELTSPGLTQDPKNLLPSQKLKFGDDMDPERDPFRAYFGEWAYFKRTRFDRLQGAANATWVQSSKSRIGFGAGMSWDDVELYELDAVASTSSLIDSLRTFHTRAPGGWAYVQQRWEHEGLVWNGGLRLQAFSAGGDARAPAGSGSAGQVPDKVSPGTHWTLSPRLGLAFPLSVRDAFSVSYARIHQPPGREYLSDSRLLIYSRHPLGDPALEPGELITYQAGVKHVFDTRWAAQVSLFQRDLYGQVGIINDPYFGNTFRARYANSEYGHATGVEFALLGGPAPAPAAGTRPHPGWRDRLLSAELGARLTIMTSHGTISSPDGWYYGMPYGFRPLPIGEHPLDWDRGQVFTFDAIWRESHAYTVAWVTQFSTGARWTPTVAYTGTPGGPVAATDLSAVNSRELPGRERTDVAVRLEPGVLRGVRLLLEVRNLFDSRGEAFASLAGFPNPTINTLRDDYGGYRTDTKNGGGAYWDPRANGGRGGWVPVNDARLQLPPRSVRLGIEAGL